MSEYLGWRERMPASGSRSSSGLDRDVIPGGPVSRSYEKYVQNIFHPMNRLKKVKHFEDKLQFAADHGLSASQMLKMERTLGPGAIDERYDNDHMFEKTPLEDLYKEIGLGNPEHALWKPYPVYTPKQSSEYYSVLHGGDRRDDSYRGSYSGSASYRERADEDYDKNNKKTLIDYQGFDSSPLSPYLYREHPYVRSQDSRIVGSNFVQLTSRPKDRFLEKIEQTLKDVRAMPRYC